MGPWHPWTCVLWSLDRRYTNGHMDSCSILKTAQCLECAVECCCGAFQRVKCDSDSLSVECVRSVQPKRQAVFRLVIATRARGLCQLPPSTVEAWDAGPCAGRG